MTLNKFFKYSLQIGIAGIVINIFLFVTNLYYELVVPVIENSSLEGAVFIFLDNLIFYTPCIFMVLFVAYIVTGQIYNKKYHVRNEDKVTEKLVEKNEAVQKVLDDKAEFLKHKYYTNCPNCGSVREENKTVCSFCGASLIIEKDKK
ncbi:MAG: hypothetical protein K5779_08015 [Saccharofermentans sp.]|nr:hypothetical protein [Saccharofermentans sp.]